MRKMLPDIAQITRDREINRGSVCKLYAAWAMKLTYRAV